jgi:hypothetical protein
MRCPDGRARGGRWGESPVSRLAAAVRVHDDVDRACSKRMASSARRASDSPNTTVSPDTAARSARSASITIRKMAGLRERPRILVSGEETKSAASPGADHRISRLASSRLPDTAIRQVCHATGSFPVHRRSQSAGRSSGAPPSRIQTWALASPTIFFEGASAVLMEPASTRPSRSSCRPSRCSQIPWRETPLASNCVSWSAPRSLQGCPKRSWSWHATPARARPAATVRAVRSFAPLIQVAMGGRRELPFRSRAYSMAPRDRTGGFRKGRAGSASGEARLASLEKRGRGLYSSAAGGRGRRVGWASSRSR